MAVLRVVCTLTICPHSSHAYPLTRSSKAFLFVCLLCTYQSSSTLLSRDTAHHSRSSQISFKLIPLQLSRFRRTSSFLPFTPPSRSSARNSSRLAQLSLSYSAPFFCSFFLSFPFFHLHRPALLYISLFPAIQSTSIFMVVLLIPSPLLFLPHTHTPHSTTLSPPSSSSSSRTRCRSPDPLLVP